MKQLFILLMAFFIVSCGTPKCLLDVNVDGFTTKGNVIYYNSQPFAVLQKVTYSLDDKKKLVTELNFKLYHVEQQSLVKNMIGYVYQNHHGVEFEIEFDVPLNGTVIL